jgi:predicted transcriptional regulator
MQKQKQQTDFTKTVGLRFYDAELIKKLEARYRECGIRYDTKNAFITDLIEAGLERKECDSELKKKLTENGDAIIWRLDLLECRIKELEESVGYIEANVIINQELLTAAYSVVKAINLGQRFSEKDLEYGLPDNMPERLWKLKKSLTERYVKKNG